MLNQIVFAPNITGADFHHELLTYEPFPNNAELKSKENVLNKNRKL
jgi:hypothetical protein